MASKKSIETEIQEAKDALKKAKKKICEAEKAAEIAEREVYEAASLCKGATKKKFVKTALKVEKATYTAGESCESASEAHSEIEEI
jgi:ribosomal protein S21